MSLINSHTIQLPLNLSQCLLFLNGEKTQLPQQLLDNLHCYEYIIAADGAWDSLKQYDFCERVDVVIGDGDSLAAKPKQFVERLDQNRTDFEKSVQALISQGCQSVDVYWGSGGEMDHFLGNLSVAAKYHAQITIRFYDAYQCYFYLSHNCEVHDAAGRMLSLYPFPTATVTSNGLDYKMHEQALTQNHFQSLRNRINTRRLKLTITGEVFAFLSHD